LKRSGFQVVTDAATGISIGLPKAYISTEKPGRYQGTKYSSSDGGIQIETLKFTDPDQALLPLYEKLNGIKNRKITYSSLHDDWFALSGTTDNYDSRFYTRFTMKNNEIRGFSINYRTELNDAMFRVVVAMSNTFDPFPLLVAHTAPDPSTLPPPNLEAPPLAPAQGGPEAAPAPGKAGTLSTATGFLISDDGWIVTASSAVRNCDQILIGAYGEAKDIRVDSEAPVAAVRLQSVDVFVPLGLSTSIPTYMMKVSAIGFPNDDRLGQHPILTAGSFLSYAGSTPNPQYAQVAGLIQPGNEGGPLVDEEGKVVGVLVDKRTLLASLGSHQDLPDTVSYAVREELLFTFLASNGIRPATRRSTLTKPEPGDIVEMAEKAIVPVVCVRKGH
jgi:S1-C subfamily serine protease